MNINPAISSSKILRTKSLTVLVLAMISISLSGCSSILNLAGNDSLAIAETLHEMPMEGFEFTPIGSPNCGFDNCDTGTSFSATPISGVLDSSYCASVTNWVNKNLSGAAAQISYNLSDLNHATYACESLLPTDWAFAITYAGFVESTLVQVYNDGKAFIVNVDGTGLSSIDEVFINVSPNTIATSSILNSLADIRKSKNVEYFNENQIQQVLDTYNTSTLASVTPVKMSWEPDSAGQIHYLYMDFGNKGILPFCLSIDPWNAKSYGTDPGPDYLVILRQDSRALDNFGFAQTEQCKSS